MKKYYFLIIVALILGLVLTGCSLLSNVGQVPTNEQSGITYLTKGVPSGLVGLWHFDEDTGTSAYDSSGNGNHGTIVGASWALPGKFGNALSFDGNDYVDCGNDTSLQITGAITIEAWIKTTQTTRGEIVSKYDAHLGERSYVFDIGYSGAGKLALSISSMKAPYTGFSMPSTIMVNDGEWHHVVAVFDPVGAYTKIFVDGIDRSGTIVGTLQPSIAVSARNLVIGAGYAASTTPNAYFFNGTIDEVRIWNVALQPDDILRPDISVEKEGPEYAHVGDIITYDYTVTNTGYVPLSAVTVSDDLAGPATYVSGDTNINGLFDLEEDWMFTADYEVPPGVDPVVNIATVFGTNPLDDSDVTAEADWSVDILYPAIEVVKSGPENAAPGETVTYNYEVTNPGDCALSDIVVSDDLVAGDATYVIGDDNTNGLLDLVETWIFTADYTIPTLGVEPSLPEYVVNTAIASGRDVHDPDTEVTATDSWSVRTMCARSIGYWGTHSDVDWCRSLLDTNSLFFNESWETLHTYFPGNGIEEDGVNPLEMLRVQLLAAELNVACFDLIYDYSRYEEEDIDEVITEVEDFLSTCGQWPIDKKEQREFRKDNAGELALKDVLDTFNNMGDECCPIEEELNANSNE